MDINIEHSSIFQFNKGILWISLFAWKTCKQEAQVGL